VLPGALLGFLAQLALPRKVEALVFAEQKPEEPALAD